MTTTGIDGITKQYDKPDRMGQGVKFIDLVPFLDLGNDATFAALVDDDISCKVHDAIEAVFILQVLKKKNNFLFFVSLTLKKINN